MEWIVKIEDEKHQRIRIVCNPLATAIFVYGEARVKNNEWTVFSRVEHGMKTDLEQLQEVMEKAVVTMRSKLKEYKNLDEGFSVLNLVAFKED